LAVTWLGAAGVMVRGRKQTVVADPYVTRVNCIELATGAGLLPDLQAIDRYLPKVDVILVGHGHADHVLDVGYLSLRDKAPVVAGLTAASIARAYGARVEDVRVVGGGDEIYLRGIPIHVTQTAHSRLPLVGVPFGGHLLAPPTPPLRANAFESGEPLFFRFVIDGVRVGHLSSAALRRKLPGDLDVDILFASLAGERKEDQVLERILKATRPKFLVPLHGDIPCLALEETPRRLPGHSVDDLVVRASVVSPRTRVHAMDPMQEQVLDVLNQRVK
jgi:L-ascorbate metabolism protein UlaG (beta-lactamase superfamily)